MRAGCATPAEEAISAEVEQRQFALHFRAPASPVSRRLVRLGCQEEISPGCGGGDCSEVRAGAGAGGIAGGREAQEALTGALGAGARAGEVRRSGQTARAALVVRPVKRRWRAGLGNCDLRCESRGRRRCCRRSRKSRKSPRLRRCTSQRNS